MAIPHRQADLPQVDWGATTVTYGRWWGQRKLDRDGVPAAYPLGFGLGYTTFSVADLCVGQLDGDELFYLASRGLPAAQARKLLTYAFAAEVIERIPVRSLVARLAAQVLARSGL
jgi:beta-glucosidase